MQCPKCSYEPTMSEMQESPESCQKCGVIYSNVHARPQVTQDVSNRKKLAHFFYKFMLACVAVVFVFGGWSFYQYRQALAAVEEQVRLTSAYVTQIVTALDDAGSMTFSEFFEKSNKGVSEIDAAMVKVSVIEPSTEAAEASIAYMKKSQEAIRGVSLSVRALLDLSSAKDRESRAADDALSSNEYVRDTAHKSRVAALDAQLKALKDMKEARANLAVTADELRTASASISGINKAALIQPPIYERLTNLKK